MEPKYIYCEWPEGEMKPGKEQARCGKRAAKGTKLCAEHHARLPFWPIDTPHTTDVPEGANK